jgi:hypothetical protein
MCDARTSLVLTAAAAVFMVSTIGAAGQDAPGRAVFTGTAVSAGGPRSSAGVTPVEIAISRWSQDAERQRLMAAMKEKGGGSMLDVLRDLKPVGTIKVPGNLSYDLHYADQIPLPDGGRRILLATDRPISHWEIASQSRSREYPFTFIELRLDKQGRGEGRISVAAQIHVDPTGEHVELVNYTREPLQLNDVKKTSG